MKDLILIGGGGHCAACIDVIESEGRYRIKGILDVPEKTGSSILAYPIIGTDSEIPIYAQDGCDFLITIGQNTDPILRIQKFEEIKSAGAAVVSLVSPRAYLAKEAEIGEGSITMHDVLIGPRARIGKNCIINTKALIEHDAIIGDHCHISTGALVNGSCRVGGSCFIGSGAVLRDGVSICAGTVIGAATVLHKSIDEPGIYVGNPVRRLR
jgi:sugar O-acyltransferase (sialic acid O-acetyltransferase NeuD family)